MGCGYMYLTRPNIGRNKVIRNWLGFGLGGWERVRGIGRGISRERQREGSGRETEK